MNELISLYEKWCGTTPHKIEKLPKAGSNRQYIRIYNSDNQSVIGVLGPSTLENECFVYLAKHFTSQGLPMPQIYAFNEERTAYIQQDLGNDSLYNALEPARKNGYVYEQKEKTLLTKVIRKLAHIQIEGAEKLDFNKCISPIRFDKRAAMFDLNYFKYSFLKTTDLPFDEILLENDMQQMAEDLAGDSENDHYFLYRDFQSRNVMMVHGEPYFIDFQGGMEGPLQYDIASFLWQASAKYPKALKDELVNEYINELQSMHHDINKSKFRNRLKIFVLFRILQVLGAYGLRGYVERKKYFLDSIPLAISNLREQLQSGSCSAYPYLEKILLTLIQLPQFTAKQAEASHSKYDGKGDLIVRIFSFSYKKGIPEDKSGNGGGYVFDCRSTHNPGRYEPYKKLTGLDEPVIKFLEEDGEILTFLESVYKLADAHVKRYMERGFTNLMFSFGCTGGQHRSVYSAEHLAEHIHKKFGIEVHIQHREQNISRILKKEESFA